MSFIAAYVDIYHLFDCLNVHICHSEDIPSGMTTELFNRITDEMTWVLYSIYSYPSPAENSRVGIGFLIKEIFEVEKCLCCMCVRRCFTSK